MERIFLYDEVVDDLNGKVYFQVQWVVGMMYAGCVETGMIYTGGRRGR